ASFWYVYYTYQKARLPLLLTIAHGFVVHPVQIGRMASHWLFTKEGAGPCARSHRQVRNNLGTEPFKHRRRYFDFQAAASATEDNPVEVGNAFVDVERHSRRKGERSHTADLHPGERHHFFSRG